MELKDTRRRLNDLLGTMYNGFPSSKKVLQELRYFSKSVCPKVLYRYRVLNEHSLMDLQNNIATFSLAKNFTADPEDCALHDYGGRDQAINTIISLNSNDELLKRKIANLDECFKDADLGIIRDSEAVLCLTDTPTSEYFWASYNNGAGADFCIAYKTEDLFLSNVLTDTYAFILPVVYVDSLPETNQLFAWIALSSLPLESQDIQALRFGIENLNLPNTQKKPIMQYLDNYGNKSPSQRKSIFDGLAYIDFIRTVFYKLNQYQPEAEWRVLTQLEKNEKNCEHPARRWPASEVIVSSTLDRNKIAAIKTSAQCPIRYVESQDRQH